MNESSDFDTSHDKMEMSNVQDGGGHLPSESKRRFLSTSLSSSSTSDQNSESDSSFEAECSSSTCESVISDSDCSKHSFDKSTRNNFDVASEKYTYTSNMARDFSFPKNEATFDDTKNRGHYMAGAHLSSESMRRFLSTTLSSSSNDESSEGSDCSSSTCEKDISGGSDFKKQTSSRNTRNDFDLASEKYNSTCNWVQNFSFLKNEATFDETKSKSPYISGKGAHLPSELIRRFLSTTLSSLSDDENSEWTDCSSSTCEDDVSDSYKQNSCRRTTIHFNLASGKYTTTCDWVQNISFPKNEATFDDTKSRDHHIGEGAHLLSDDENSEWTDCSSSTCENDISDYDFDVASDVTTFGWVKKFCGNYSYYEATMNRQKIGSCSNSSVFKQVRSNKELDNFVYGFKQQIAKYWKGDEIDPALKSNKIKEQTPPERMCKVTFAPDDRLVTVHTFEREPEELLPDTSLLDQIRFKMRINSFDQLMIPFHTVEHRIQIMKRNGFNQNEL